jgi:hypothetical protein
MYISSSTSRQDLEQNQMFPLSLPETKSTRTKSTCPPQLVRTTSHLQIAHELGQQGPYVAARMDAPSSDR